MDNTFNIKNEINETVKILTYTQENNYDSKRYAFKFLRRFLILTFLFIFLVILIYKSFPLFNNRKIFNKHFNLTLRRKYDYLLIGAGLFNAVLAEHFIRQGKSVLVIEKRNHIAGNCYTEKQFNIDIHKYGPHVFHTSNKTVWDYINQFGEFKHIQLTTLAKYNDSLYSLPFNMFTFYKLFNTEKPEDAAKKIKKEIEKENITEIKNLEDQAISMVGRTIFEKLIKEYTEKQWERDCKELDPNIIKRLPLRFTFNNNYFDDLYQGVPINGYTEVINNMYKGADIFFGIDFLKDKDNWEKIANKIFYSGCIDEYYDYKFGPLQYRNVKFKEKILDIENYQGTPVINYPSKEYPYTRITEHKHFIGNKSKKTIISEEYSSEWKKGDVPFYPVNNKENLKLLKKYKSIKNNKVYFVGRLGMYKYLDMDDTIIEAFNLLKQMKIRM